MPLKSEPVLLAAALLLAFAVPAWAAEGLAKVEIQWIEELAVALKQARQDQKPLVIYFHPHPRPGEDYEKANRSPAALEGEVLRSERFNALASRAVFAWVDAEKGDDDVTRLLTDLKIDRVPAIVVLDVTGDKIAERGRVIGYFPLDDFMGRFMKVMNESPGAGKAGPAPAKNQDSQLDERQIQAIVEALRALRAAEKAAAEKSAAQGKQPAPESAPAEPQPPKEGVVQRVIRATAWVQTPADSSGRCSSGTAWVYDVEKKVLVTNFHVVAQFSEQSDPLLDREPRTFIHGKVGLLFPAYRDNGELINEKDYYLNNQERLVQQGRILAARVVDADMTRDLAILQTESLPPGVRAIPLAAKSQVQGDTHFSIGNPSDSFFWMHTSGKARNSGFKRWRSAGGRKFMHHAARVLITQAPTNPGDSGGPVANDQGELVGVTQGGARGVDAINYAIDVTEVRDYLKETAWLLEVKGPSDLIRRGQYYARRDLPLQADADFRKALAELGPGDSAARVSCLLDLAAVERRLLNTTEVEKCCDQAMAEMGEAIPAKDPLRARAHAERAAALLIHLKPPSYLSPKAAALLERFKGAPQPQRKPATIVEIMRTAWETGVRENVRRALETDPDCALAYWVRAEFRALGGRGTSEEIADRTEVVRLRKDDTTAILERQRAYFRAKQYDRAIDDCEAVLKIVPESIVARLRLSECREAKGDLAAALKDAQIAAQKLEPENPANWDRVARLCEALADHEGTVASLTVAMKMCEDLRLPPGRQRYFLRGNALAALKKYSKARADYRDALETPITSVVEGLFDPTDEAIREKLRALPPE